MRKRAWYTALLSAVVLTLVCGGVARAEANDCSQPPKESHYAPLAGEVEDGSHFSVQRPFYGAERLELNVCAGELRVRRSNDGQLHLSVVTDKQPELKMRAYVRTIDVNGARATISLDFPGNVHPVVVLQVPATANLHSEINLGKGTLEFFADQVSGSRNLNVGYGHATLYLEGDRDYSRLQANVGMGSFHDHRPGGGSAHFSSSHDLTGKGVAPIEINVGMGSLDLQPAED